MKLQPLDIKRQTFAKAFRGYEPAEVDSFLKQIADQQAALLDELRQVEDRVRDAESKLKHYERVEMALQEALETARETGKRAEEAAERQTRAMIASAEARAEEIVRDAERERYTLRQDVRKLSTRQTEVAARLRGFLLSELEVLAQFQGDDPVGFLKLQPAGTSHALPPVAPAQLTADATPSSAASEEAPPTQTLAEDTGEATEVATRWDAPVESEPSADPVAGTVADAPRPEAPAAPEPTPEPASAEAPSAEASGWQRPAWSDVPTAEPAPAEAPAAPPVWNLRSLVTGGDDAGRSAGDAGGANVAGSEAERERIRRILDDLD